MRHDQPLSMSHIPSVPLTSCPGRAVELRFEDGEVIHA